MKCPQCGQTISRPSAQVVQVEASFKPVEVIILVCPNCDAVLGAVNEPKTEQ